MLRTSWSTYSRRLTLLALPALLLAAGCSASSVVANPTATPTPAPTATPTATPLPTTCAQIQGFGAATAANINNIATTYHMEFPANAIGAAPTTSFGGAGQYTVTEIDGCAPNTDTSLTVQTGKGPEPFTTLVLFYGWTPWQFFPLDGSAQQACDGVACFASNVDRVNNGIFHGVPTFMSFDAAALQINGLETFHLRIASSPPAPVCSSNYDTFDDMVFGHHPEYSIYAFQGGPIQWPPLTRFVGDSTPSTIGSDQCSAGTIATIKAFMDNQFSSNGGTAVGCGGNDCWMWQGVTYTMAFNSATDWVFSHPRT